MPAADLSPFGFSLRSPVKRSAKTLAGILASLLLLGICAYLWIDSSSLRGSQTSLRSDIPLNAMAVPKPKSGLPTPWPFDQVPNTAVFTTTHVLRESHPITHVFHDASDHGWQFHYPGGKSEADIMIVALEEIVLHDPTVVEIADLPPGWRAIRSNVGQPWKKEENR
jgi:hypothetical protein